MEQNAIESPTDAMHMERLISGSRMDAVEILENMLQNAVQLESLVELRENYEACLKASDIKLAEASSTRTSEMATVLRGLEDADNAIGTIYSTCFDIQNLSSECQGLVASKDSVRQLSIALRNHETVIRHVEMVSSVEARAEKVQQMLKDPTNFVQAYERLAVLESDIAMFKNAMIKDVRKSEKDLLALESYFVEVEKTNRLVEEELWKVFDEVVSNCRDNPQKVVQHVKIIVCQEMIEKKRKSLGTPYLEKRWRDKCIKRMQSRAKQHFQELIEQSDAGGSDPIEICDELTSLLLVLVDYFDLVKPCFPPDYMLFESIQKVFHDEIVRAINIIGGRCEEFSSQGIVKLLSFVESYKDLMQTLNANEQQLWIPLDKKDRVEKRVASGVLELLAEYENRVLHTLSSWNAKLMDLELSDAPKQKDSGKVWTPIMVDMFHSVNEQVNALTDVGSGILKLFVAQTCLQSILNFQNMYRDGIKTISTRNETYLQRMCAAVNNCLSAYDLSEELKEAVEDTVQEKYHGLLDIEKVCRGFLDICSTAIQAIVEEIFSDPGFRKLLHQLFDKVWTKGRISASIILTLQDYLSELKVYTEPSYYKRLCEKAMLEFAQIYMEGLLLSASTLLDDQRISRMESDYSGFSEFFSGSIQPKKVKSTFQFIQDFVALATAPNIERFTLSYILLLKNQAWLQAEIAEKMVLQRFDTQLAEVQQGIERIQESWEKQGSRKQVQQKGFHRRVRSLSWQIPSTRQAPAART